MAANRERKFAPQNNMSDHAHILNACTRPRLHTPLLTASGSSPQSILHEITSDYKREYHITSNGNEAAASSCRSPRLNLLTPHHITDATSSPECLFNPSNVTGTDSYTGNANSSGSNSPSSGLKLRLRGIQAALKESPFHSTDGYSLQSKDSSGGKRTSSEAAFDDDPDTDSEIDIMPRTNKVIKLTARERAKRTGSKRSKKIKAAHEDRDFKDEDAMFDAVDEDSSPNSPDDKLILSTHTLKRSERIMDPSNPEHANLIAAATKAGPEYYDSDTDDLLGNVKETNKPHLFRNIKWGSLATDYSNPAVFTTEPEFTQFVPGRFERLPDGKVSDQKSKLIIKLTDKQHRQRIFLNPPPRDWNNQEAITALNKRTVQQIRRNTSIRFREVVEPYVKEEREWILAHLTRGKPTSGWKKFVDDFNRRFEGKKLEEGSAARPERSHSSLTKEVERFGNMYSKGVVPKTTSQGVGTKRTNKAE